MTLRFPSDGSGSATSTHNLNATFALNRLLLESARSGSFIIDSLPGRTLRLTGTSPQIAMNGLGDVTLRAPMTLAPTSGVVSIVGSALGNLAITSVISQSSTTGLLINAPAASAEGGMITLSGANTFSGGVTLQSGNLAVGHNSALGTGTFRVKGGTFRFAASGFTIPNAIALESDLVITGTRTGTLSGPISSAVPGTGLSLRINSGGGTVQLTAPATYSGPTRIDHGLSGSLQFGAAPGILLQLTGNGSILNTSSIDVRAGGLLHMSGSAAGATNRVPDAAPIALRGGGLFFSGSASSINTQIERLGPIAVAGFASMSAGDLGNTRLTAASISRVERGTIQYKGSWLGSSPSTTSSNIFFDAPPQLTGGGSSGANMSIIPSAIGEQTVGGLERVLSLVTYDATNGIRPLDKDTEYAKTLPAPAPTNNVWLDANTVVSSDATVNALRLGAANQLSGAGTVSITSGALLAAGADVNISAPLNFGASEAQIFAIGSIMLSGVTSGSNGLTKSGSATLSLRGTNNITGPLTINGGTVDFQKVADLGPSAEPITIGGPFAGLTYSGSGLATLARPVHIGGGVGRLIAASGVFEISGGINGESLHASGLGGTVRLTGTNAHSGLTLLTGDVEIGGDEVFGSSEVHASGTLRLTGPWTASRTLKLDSSLTLDTAGFDSTLSGTLLGTSPLTKTGAGTLTITAASPSTGNIVAGGGTLRLSKAGQLRTAGITVAPGGRLVLDDSEGFTKSRINDGGAVFMEGGELAFVGSAAGPSREKIGALVRNRGTSVVSLTPAAGQALTLEAASLSSGGGGTLLVRSDYLGAPAGGTTARLNFIPFFSPGGLVLGVYGAPSAGGGESLMTYDFSSDAVGIVGVKPLRTNDYTPVGTISNPTVPPTAHVLVENAATTAGPANSVATVTFAPGSTLTLDPGETLNVSSGNVLVRSGGAASLSGGTLDFGSALGRLAAFGDVSVASVVTGTRWEKYGPGILTVSTQPAGAAELLVASGPVRVASPDALSAQTLGLGNDAVFDLNGSPATVGALAGVGTIAVGNSALRLGTLGTSFTANAQFTGTGSVTLVDGGARVTREFVNRASIFDGSVILESGDASFTQSDHVTRGPLVFAGGRVTSTGAITMNTPVVLATDFRASSPSAVRFLEPATLTGSGTLRADGADVYLYVPTAFTGQTVIENGRALYLAVPDGQPTASGGTVGGTAAIFLRSNGLLALGERSASSSAAFARLPDTAPISIEGSKLTYAASTDGESIETIGALRVGARATIELGGGPGAIAGLAAPTLERQPGGTLLVNGAGFGETLAPSRTELRIAARPALVGGDGTGANTSVLPWVTVFDSANFANGTMFATWRPGVGLRALNAETDFVEGPSAVAQPTNNLRITEPYSLDAPLTVNSLFVRAHDSTVDYTGTGMMTVTSGGIIVHGRASIAHPLAFGAAEAIIHLQPDRRLELRGPISGSGGLTAAGNGELILGGANSFSGPLRVQGPDLQFAALQSLGSDTSRIVLDGGRLTYTGAPSVTLSRDLEVIGNTPYFTPSLRVVSPGTIVTLAGVVSGPAQLQLSGSSTSGFHLTGANTHTGGTLINSLVTFSTEAAFGGGPISLGAGTLRATFPWTTSRPILSSGYGRFDTNGFDVTWDGPVSADVIKMGAGRLTLRGGAGVTGELFISEGTVALEGTIGAESAAGSDPINTQAGGTITGSATAPRKLINYGTVAPGSGAGTLSVNDTTFFAGSTLALELAAADAFDRLRVQGNVVLSGDTALGLALAFDPADGVDSFLVLENDGVDPIDLISFAGSFSINGDRLDENEIFSVGAQAFRISYTGGTGNDLVLYAVPEPHAAMLALCAALVLTGRRRR